MRKLRLAALLLLLFFPAVLSAGEKKAPPEAGDEFPAVSLPVPEAAEHRDYLNIDRETGSFDIGRIDAEILIIEIFSMYCPHCQREAPAVNALYERIEAGAGLKGKVKLIGIGAGNSAYEVKVFREKYKVPFPLFSDPDFEIYGRLGDVRTPYFFAVALRSEGPATVIYSELGAIEAPERFLEQITRAAQTLLED